MRTSGVGSKFQNDRFSYAPRLANVACGGPQPLFGFAWAAVNGALRHPLRVGTRLAWLAREITWIALNYVPRVALRSDSSLLQAKARWLQWGCRRVIKIFRLEIHAAESVPRQGLMVSNHLSYLDVLVFSALTPCVFVAKREVKDWPVFGWFARLAGTLFADRQRRLQVGVLAKALKDVLDQGTLVVLFPEGTSSDGQTVLPFKSALLSPVATCAGPVAASVIHYFLNDGDVKDEVCYWKDMTLLPHLINLLSKQSIVAGVGFSQMEVNGSDRKMLARRLHAKVQSMKNGSLAAAAFTPYCGN